MAVRWMKSGVLVLVVAGLAALPATAQGLFKFGRQDRQGVRTVHQEGRPMVQARPFFQRSGGQIERDRDDYLIRRGGHEWRFRPGSRSYYYDRQPRTFVIAPQIYAGSLYVPPDPFLNDWGWRYDRYPDSYCINCGNDWMGPGRLEIRTPPNGANVRGNYAVLGGLTTPSRDLHVALYIRDRGDDWRFVYDTPARAQGDGQYAVTLRLPQPARYRAVVQLLNDVGGIEEERARQFEWD